MKKNDWLTRRWKVALLALFACFLWGSAFPSTKISYTMLHITKDFQMIQLAGIRFFIAGVLVLLFAAIALKTQVFPVKGEWRAIILLALLQTGLTYTLYYIGLSNTSAVKGSILSTAEIFVSVLITPLFFRDERISLLKLLGLALGLGGIILANLANGKGLAWSFALFGEGFLLIKSLAVTFSLIVIRKFSGRVNAFRVNAWQFLIGGAILGAIGFAGSPQVLPVTAESGLLILYTACISAVAYSIWYLLLQKNNVSDTSFFKFSVPIFGSIIAVLTIPAERFDWAMLGGLILVASGIIVTNLPERGAQKSTAADCIP